MLFFGWIMLCRFFSSTTKQSNQRHFSTRLLLLRALSDEKNKTKSNTNRRKDFTMPPTPTTFNLTQEKHGTFENLKIITFDSRKWAIWTSSSFWWMGQDSHRNFRTTSTRICLEITQDEWRDLHGWPSSGCETSEDKNRREFSHDIIRNKNGISIIWSMDRINRYHLRWLFVCLVYSIIDNNDYKVSPTTLFISRKIIGSARNRSIDSTGFRALTNIFFQIDRQSTTL